jgi:hypothetical protein
MTDENEKPTDTDPNYSAARTTISRNGTEREGMTFTFGTPKRSITVADLTLGDQFDLVETAGDQAGNSTWMMMAGLAWSTTEIDGVPWPASRTRAAIKAALDRIKPDGLSAYFKALRDVTPPVETTVAAAKN